MGEWRVGMNGEDNALCAFSPDHVNAAPCLELSAILSCSGDCVDKPAIHISEHSGLWLPCSMLMMRGSRHNRSSARNDGSHAGVSNGLGRFCNSSLAGGSRELSRS